MKNRLFYFSATGNSLAVTKVIANKLGDSEMVGLIFPVYCLDIPKIVKDFIKKVNFNSNPYIFSIATNNREHGYALVTIDKLLKERGQNLDLGYTLVMPGNSVVIQDNTNSREEQILRINNSKVIIREMIKDIQEKRKAAIEGDFSLKDSIKGLIYQLAVYKIYKPQNHFWTTEQCTRCGICKKVCPTENIILEEQGVEWANNCEGCLACFHWCPQSAINLGSNTLNKNRYHHPEVSLAEIIK